MSLCNVLLSQAADYDRTSSSGLFLVSCRKISEKSRYREIQKKKLCRKNYDTAPNRKKMLFLFRSFVETGAAVPVYFIDVIIFVITESDVELDCVYGHVLR